MQPKRVKLRKKTEGAAKKWEFVGLQISEHDARTIIHIEGKELNVMHLRSRRLHIKER
jgi:hypothetical protein